MNTANNLLQNRALGSLATGLVAFMAGVVCMAVPATAFANWNFDPSCSAVEVSEVEDPEPPNAFIMLDQSGSMGFNYGSDGQSLWDVAVQAINQATNGLDDEIRFGLGLFPASSCTELCLPGLLGGACFAFFCSSRSGASEVVQSDFNNHDTIANTLEETYPNGGTPTAAAVSTVRGSASMNEAGRAAGGIVITDGQPGDASAAIDEACQLREEGKLGYAVGLGGATNQNFNNKMAAALGTGCCGPAANPECTNGLGADPCSSNPSGTSCHGSYQANNQTEFRNVLLEISGEIGCTFPIDTSLHSEGEAPDDTGAVRVELLLAEGPTEIEHRDVSDDGEGWFFPSSDSRDQITLTDGYCSEVQAGHVDTVETQLACDCQEPEGTACDVNNPPPGTCPEGRWNCSTGYDYCEPLEAGECPYDCPGYEDTLGDNCYVGDTADDILEANPDNYRYPVSRCEVGEVVCPEEALEPVCEQRYQPMPEICDGMDNSCDGRVDNIEVSWADWYEAQDWDDWVQGRDSGSGSQSWPVGMELPNDLRGGTCGLSDICACPNGSAAVHSGEGDSIEEEFEDYLESRDTSCSCVAPLQ